MVDEDDGYSGQRLPQGGVISDKIAEHYPTLTGALRRLADFVLEQPLEVARMSIHAVVAEVGVSVASANRFATALGFSGYADFRNGLIKSFESAFEPVNRLKAPLTAASTDLDVFSSSLQEDIRNIERTLQILSAEKCTAAVDMVLRAGKVYVIGFDNGASLASMLATGLEVSRGGVQAISGSEGGAGAARRLFRYGPSDLVIAIALPRYFKDTIELARFAQSQGVPILAITDGPRSPLVAIADLTLYCNITRSLGSTADTGVLALIEALKTAVARRAVDSVKVAEHFATFAFPWFEPEPGPGPSTPKAERPGRKKPPNSQN